MSDTSHAARATAERTYTVEYMAAFDRTESFGIKAPRRMLVRKDCIDPTFALAACFEVLLPRLNQWRVGIGPHRSPFELIHRTQ